MRRQAVQHLAGAVGGAVVDDQNLALGRQRHLEQPRITAATVADSLKTGTMIEISGGHGRLAVSPDAAADRRRVRRFRFFGGAFATGAGRYSISTLLIVATGRPAEVN